MKIFFILAVLALGACDADLSLKCDYCRVVRESVFRYMCDKCKETHTACAADRGIIRYEGSGKFSGNFFVMACPAPRDPSAEVEPPALFPIAEKDIVKTPSKERLLDTTVLAILGALLIVVGVGCYGKGRSDEKKVRDE